jgi:hypothetical protein
LRASVGLGSERGVVWTIARDGNPYAATHVVRRLDQRGGFLLGKMGSDAFTPDDHQALVARIERSLPDPEETEAAMVDAIRAVLSRSDRPTVGPDCMAVLIPPLARPQLEIHYRPLVEARAKVVTTPDRPTCQPHSHL